MGVARIRTHLKDANGWELSEKRVKKILTEIADGKSKGNSVAGDAPAAGSGSKDTAVATWTPERPSPRGYFSLTAVHGTSSLVMFGGEYFDNAKNMFYNQLYKIDLSTR